MAHEKKNTRLTKASRTLQAPTLSRDSNQQHHVLWELSCLWWQGALRHGDVLRREIYIDKPWSPEEDTHRGRITLCEFRDSNGRLIGDKLILIMYYTKTEQSGTAGCSKRFILDNQDGGIGAADELLEMLRHNPSKTMYPYYYYSATKTRVFLSHVRLRESA